ncbi:MAG: hypothetical protein AAFY84_06160 [Pseudomonadota bacterium]
MVTEPAQERALRDIRFIHHLLRSLASRHAIEVDIHESDYTQAFAELGIPYDFQTVDDLIATYGEISAALRDQVEAVRVSGLTLVSDDLEKARLGEDAIALNSAGYILAAGVSVALIILALKTSVIVVSDDGFRAEFQPVDAEFSNAVRATADLATALMHGNKAETEKDDTENHNNDD